MNAFTTMQISPSFPVFSLSLMFMMEKEPSFTFYLSVCKKQLAQVLAANRQLTVDLNFSIFTVHVSSCKKNKNKN